MSSTKPILLICGPIETILPDLNSLSSTRSLDYLPSISRAEFILECKPGGRYDAIQALYWSPSATSIYGPPDRDLIAAFPPSLKAICSFGAGYDRIDVLTALERGIQVSNTPGAVDAATATTAMWLIISALRGFTEGELRARRGTFDTGFALKREPEGKVLGIVGMGGIGRALAKRALGFEMEVVYYNRRRVEDQLLAESGILGAVTYIDNLDELLVRSDVVSLNLPLNDSTRGFFNESCFNKMKDGSVLVNTARGSVVDEPAMLRALASGKLYSAGLDVFDCEPDIHPDLVKNEGITLLPHLGTSTVESTRRMELQVLQNITELLNTGRVVNPVPDQQGKL